MRLFLSLSTLLLAPAVLAQDFLFSVSQPEQTLSGSGGTVLRYLYPNEIVSLQAFPCPHLSEKFSPRGCFDTQAGDEDNDDAYWEPGLFGSIDALLTTFNTAGAAITNQRTVWYSPSVAMGTTISGGPGLRPGDVGRIVRTSSGDGKVQYFIRAEQIQVALGLPPVPVLIDVDAIASSPNYGVFLSLDQDIVVPLCSGPTLLRDGDVFAIAAPDIVWNPNGTVNSVTPGSAVVVYTEAQMDAFTTNANVTDRNGVCVNQVVDTEGLEIDWNGGVAAVVPGCTGIAVLVPELIFTAETLTGGAILTTMGGGTIYSAGCGPLGTTCGFGPTLGNQIGLLPPTAAMGVASYVSGIANSRVVRFVAEAQAPVIPALTPAQIDFASPGALTWVFFAFAPSGPGVVAPSTPFPWGVFCYPDYYAVPNFMGVIGTGTGFGTYTSPPIPWPCDLVWFGVTITPMSTIEVSSPTMVEVF